MGVLWPDILDSLTTGSGYIDSDDSLLEVGIRGLDDLVVCMVLVIEGIETFEYELE